MLLQQRAASGAAAGAEVVDVAARIAGMRRVLLQGAEAWDAEEDDGVGAPVATPGAAEWGAYGMLVPRMTDFHMLLGTSSDDLPDISERLASSQLPQRATSQATVALEGADGGVGEAPRRRHHRGRHRHHGERQQAQGAAAEVARLQELEMRLHASEAQVEALRRPDGSPPLLPRHRHPPALVPEEAVERRRHGGHRPRPPRKRYSDEQWKARSGAATARGAGPRAFELLCPGDW